MPKELQIEIPVDEPVKNWTPFPNFIIDNLHKFTELETKILCEFVRKHPAPCELKSFLPFVEQNLYKNSVVYTEEFAIQHALERLEKNGWIASIDKEEYVLSKEVWNA